MKARQAKPCSCGGFWQLGAFVHAETCERARRASRRYTRFELTARECRELCEALAAASVLPWFEISERRLYRLWLLFDAFAAEPRREKKRHEDPVPAVARRRRVR